MSTSSPSHEAQPADSLTVSTTRVGRAVVAFVAGEADWATAERLRDALLATLSDGPSSLDVDLSDVTFCNLRGLDSLHAVVRSAQQAGVRVTLRGMSRQLSWLQRTFPGRLWESGSANDAGPATLRAVPGTPAEVEAQWDPPSMA